MHTENAVLGNRRWLVYVVLAAAMGQDQWIVAAEENKNTKEVKVVVRVSTIGNAITPMPVAGSANGNYSVATLPGVENTVEGKALYFVFFKRLDFLLGKEQKWYDCDTAENEIKKQKIDGRMEQLCDGITQNDDFPEGYKH